MNSTPKPIIDSFLSKRVLTVGEYYLDRTHGGIASVLRYYEPYFATFQFIPSSRRPTLGSKLAYDLFSLFRLFWKLLWNPKIRLVHIHTASGRSFPKHLYYAGLSRFMGRKVILHCHAARFHIWFESLTAKRQQQVLQALLKVDKIIVLSQSWKEYFVTLGVPEDNLVVLNNITPNPGKGICPRMGGEALRLLFLGEIGERKGVFDILAALKDLPEKDRVHLDIGGNRMENELRAKIKEYGLSDCVTFHGFVGGEQKLSLLEKAHIFILPSWNEGLPIAILEAMSYGCAVISTPVGGIPEVVKENGILVHPGNIDEIAKAIVSMLDEAQRCRMGIRSLELVKPYYPDAVLSHLREVYLELLAE